MLQQFQITYLQCTPKTHLISLSFIIKALYYTITAHKSGPSKNYEADGDLCSPKIPGPITL